MLWAALHRLLVVLTLLAFVGGMTLQLMPPKIAFAASPTPAAGDCSHITTPRDHGSNGQKVPCQDTDLPECIKQMGCLGTPSLPLGARTNFVPFGYNKIAYSTPPAFRDGRSIEPDLFPPIGL
jgi:hypothetical protein